MPTYEYECEDCKHRFEVFQKITDKPVKKCPKCNGKVRRLISGGIGVIFKGSGFYETDYKRKSKSPGNRATPKEEKTKEKDTHKATDKKDTKTEGAKGDKKDSKSSSKEEK